MDNLRYRHATILAGLCVVLGAAICAAAPPEELDPAGPRPPRRHIAPGPMLSLQAPTLEAPLLSQVPATLRIGTAYTGSRLLTYSLTQGPDGMTLDAKRGVLLWTPPLAMEGQEATVKVAAGDGALAADVTFALQVAATQPVTTVLAGSTITVTQSGSLKELSFSFPTRTTISLDQVKVSQLTVNQVAPMPSGVTRVSDFFRVTPTFGLDGLITVAMPATNLPAGRRPQDLRLYIFTDGIQDAEFGSDPSGTAWVRTWYSLDVLPNGKVTVKLQSVGSVSFIGMEAPVVPPSGASGLLTVRLGPLGAPATCVGELLSDGQTDLNRQVCTVEYVPGKSFVAIVKNVGDLHLDPPAGLSDVLDWLAAGRRTFEGYRLKSDDTFEVDIGPMPNKDYLGFVTAAKDEDRRVLHITNVLKPREAIQGTVVHEYFHHAQSRTTETGKTNLMNLTPGSNWLIEGLARWFEDEAFDNLDTYKLKESPTGPAILEKGLDARPNMGDPRTSSYARFAFWKMISSHCPGFSVPAVLNVPGTAIPPTDPSGLLNLKSTHELGTLRCTYQDTWGANNSSFIAPLLYYAYATVKNQEGGMSLFDSDEPPYTFAKPDEFPFYRPHLTPSKECRTWVDCPWRSEQEGAVASAGVYALYVDPPLTSTPDEIVQVVVDTVRSDQKLFVWGGQNETAGGLAEGFYSDLSNSIKMTYHQDHGTAPHLLGLIVNPDPASDVPFRACAAIAAVGLTIPTATITIDGNTEDWAGIAPLVTSPRGGGSPDYPGSDIQALYAAKDTNNLYLRMDLWDNANTSFMNLPPPNDGCYRFWIENTGKDYRAFEVGVAFDGDSWGVGINGSNSGSVPESVNGPGLVSVKGRVIELRIPLTDRFRPAGFTKLGARAVAIGSGDPIRTLDEVSLKVFEPKCHRTQAAVR